MDYVSSQTVTLANWKKGEMYAVKTYLGKSTNGNGDDEQKQHF